jgi:hypothetical protein
MKEERIYLYKDRKYKFISIGRMKIGQLWIDCIIYKSLNDRLYYVREELDFYEKFKEFIDGTN